MRLSLAADPQQIGGEQFAALPGRIRTALRDFHITIALTAEAAEDDTPDAMLLDSDAVRLVKAKPRA